MLLNPRKILVIIQRSNGDVFYSSPLIRELKNSFKNANIDILVNDDTYQIANIIPNVEKVITFSYKLKKQIGFKQDLNLLKDIYKKYDLAINLTTSDRSVLISYFASKYSISAIENENRKSWWKKIILTSYYFFDVKKHILLNNLEPLNLLGIRYNPFLKPILPPVSTRRKIKDFLNNNNITEFLIFHPSAQYDYKILPISITNQIIKKLENLGPKIIITGGNSGIDTKISKSIITSEKIINLIGKTTILEFIELSRISTAYVGMDTLNMHIASSQNKKVFAFFGPTNQEMWAPWSNLNQVITSNQTLKTSYGNVTLLHSNMSCLPCGRAGCNDQHDRSICMSNINPDFVFSEIKNWYVNHEV